MHPLRRLTVTAALAALVVAAPRPTQAYYAQPDNARMRVDINLANATIYFNKTESRLIAAGSAGVGRIPVPGWIKAFLVVIGSHVAGEVAKGRCVKVKRPYVGIPTYGFYTGGYCR